MIERNRILITGGGRGIGARVAEVLADTGCRLTICARNALEIAAMATSIEEHYSVPVLGIACDVSDADAVAQMVDDTLDFTGGIDVLVNCAGVAGELAVLEEADADEWRQVIEINLFGTVYCTRAVLPSMKKQGHGKIINFAGAGAGWKDFPQRQTAYVSSKFAVCGFTEALAMELADANIQVNALSPGPVATRLWDGVVSSEKQRALEEKGFDLTPEAAARMIAFIASERSGALTGKILSARWDNPDELTRDIEALNNSCRKTLRKIDDTHYLIAE